MRRLAAGGIATLVGLQRQALGVLIDGRRLLVATHNPGKLREFAYLLEPHGIEVVGAAGAGPAEPEETGDSFAANAALKARAAATATGLPALADDSGIVVHGLDGQPGIHSARWAGPERDFDLAIGKVLDGLAARYGSFAAADRRAEFVAVLCLALPEAASGFFEGRVAGTPGRPAARRRRLRLRPDLRPRGPDPHLRRDDRGREARHQPPPPRPRRLPAPPLAATLTPACAPRLSPPYSRASGP